MALVFRTTGSGTWGTGKGSGLTSTEIDNNFYELNRDKLGGTGNTGTITTSSFIQTAYPLVAPTTISNPGTGVLGELTPVSTGIATLPRSIVVEPIGRFVYFSNTNGNSVGQYRISQTSGELTLIANALSTGAGSAPHGITTDPQGRFVYIANQGVNSVGVYSINQTTGELTLVQSIATAGNNPYGIVVEPKGKFLYVACYASSVIQQYSINQTTGLLTSTGTVASNYPAGIVIDPTGRFLYICSIVNNAIFQYSINQTTGALTSTGTTIATTDSPDTIVIDPSGRFLYVNGNDVRVCSINQATGQLTLVSTFAPGTGQVRGIAIDPSGRFAYVSILSSPGVVRSFSINQTTGELTQLAFSNFASNPHGIAIDPSGKFLYVANGSGNTILPFVRHNFSVGSATIGGSVNINGTLSAVTGTIGTLTVPNGLSVSSTTESTTTTTGALTVGGGVGIGGALNVGGVIKLPGVGASGFVKLGAGGQLSADTSTYLTSYTETDTLATVTGRANGATTSTAISITNTSASTSSATGALIVAGGVGIGGALVVGGNLTVNGTTTTVNSNTLSVDDRNIELGAVTTGTVTGNITANSNTITGLSSTVNITEGSVIVSASGAQSVTIPANLTVIEVVSPTQILVNQALTGSGIATGAVLTFSGANNATANGGGITLKGTTDKTILWDSTNSNWTSSENWNIATGKTFKINNVNVLSATTLGTAVVNSSLTKLGTVAGFVKSDASGNLSADTNTYSTTAHGHFIGTTAVQASSANQALTGITSITGANDTAFTIAPGNITAIGAFNTIIRGAHRTVVSAASDSAGTVALSGGDVQAGDGSFVIGGNANIFGGYVGNVTGDQHFGGDVTILSGGTSRLTGIVRSGNVYIDVGDASPGYTGDAANRFIGQINIGTGSNSTRYIDNVAGFGPGRGDIAASPSINIGSYNGITTINSATVKLANIGESGFVKLGAGGQLSADTTTYLSGTVAATSGGTGITAYAIGDIIYASNTNVLSRRAKGDDGQVLKLSGGVPVWAADNDTVYTLPTATKTVLGGIKLGSDTAQTTAANAVTSTSSRTYAIQVNASGEAVVNVPWVDTDTDTNTTYSASTGLTLTGTAFSVNYGTTATTACVGNDSRLSDARAHNGTAINAATGTILTITGATSPSTGAAAFAVDILGGQGSSNSVASLGGAVNITGGRSGYNSTGSGGGGAVNITGGGGNTLGAAGVPGAVNITAGSPMTAGQAGAGVNISATGGNGTSAASANGGNIVIKSGPGTSSGGNSGSVTIAAPGDSGGTKPSVIINVGGTGNGTYIAKFVENGLSVGTASNPDAAGSILAAGNITAYSDKRLKTNITKIDDALNKVQQLNGYTFDRIDIEGSRQTGVIAQEVLKVLPEAVFGTEDSTYSVAYGNMIGLMIEAIKELNAKVEDLQNQLTNK